MGFGTKWGKVANATYTAPAAVTGVDVGITWTTKEPTASTAVTFADGSAPTSTELGIYVASINPQIQAMIDDIAAIRTALVAAGVDTAAMLAQLNKDE